MRVLAVATLSFGLVTMLHAQANPKVVLVELFTSEGCSSCPPADALLARLNGTRTESGQLVVGISEHVTYWNSLGWTDPFSQELFTARQRSYAGRFRLDSVYTPQVVVDGTAEVLGNDPGAIGQAVRAEKSSGVSLSIMQPSVTGDMLTGKVTVMGAQPGATVYAVVAEDRSSSKVLRGENGGRTLTHVAVARSLEPVGKGAGTIDFSVHLPKPVAGQSGEGRHLILFVQERDYGRVLAAESTPIGPERSSKQEVAAEAVPR